MEGWEEEEGKEGGGRVEEKRPGWWAQAGAFPFPAL